MKDRGADLRCVCACVCVCPGMCACIGVCACVNACACVPPPGDSCPTGAGAPASHWPRRPPPPTPSPFPLLPALAGTRRGARRPARPCLSRARPGLVPSSPSPRRRRALPSSGSGCAGASPGTRSPAAVALVTPVPGHSGEPGEGARGGTGGGGVARQPPRLPSRSLALCLACSLAQRRQ